MAGKYQPLTEYLRRQPGDSVQLTLVEISAVIHMPLPPSARLRHWWSASTAAHGRAWRSAGWRVKFPGREAGRVVAVTFVR